SPRMKNSAGNRLRSSARFSLMALVGLALAGGAAAVRGQSALDGFDPNANGTVYVVVVQPDGKILIGGDFTTLSPNGGAAVTRSGIARLNADGTLDTAFNPNANEEVILGVGVGGSGRSIAVQADGKILVGGHFSSIGGQTRNYFVRLSNAAAALQNLAVTQTNITWTRGGSSPQLTRVTFEYSTDMMNYTPLGAGMFADSNWTLADLSY